MRKEFGFNNNIIGIPKNGTTQNTINCSFGLPNCCNQELLSILDNLTKPRKEYQIEQ